MIEPRNVSKQMLRLLLVILLSIPFKSVIFATARAEMIDVSPPRGAQVGIADRTTRWHAFFFVEPQVRVKVLADAIDTSKLPFSNVCGEDYELAMTGGFFENSDQRLAPVGLTISNGEIQVPKADWNSGGLVWVDNNDKVSFDHFNSEFTRLETSLDEIAEAIQSRPFIIENGQFDERTESDTRWDRIGIGSAARGGIEGVLVVAAISDLSRRRAQTMGEFAGSVLRIAGNRGISVIDFLALDGAAGSFVSIRKSGKYFGSRTRRYVPTIMCLK